MESEMRTALSTDPPNNASSIHKMELVYKDGWAAGYGDTSQSVKKPWAVCSCGFEQDLYGNHDNRFELVRLNHLLIAVAMQVGVIVA